MGDVTYKSIPTFFCEQVEPLTRRMWYRRYSSETQCPGHFCHNAQIFLRDEQFAWKGKGDRQCYPDTFEEQRVTPKTAWPTKCDYCEYQFLATDEYQIFYDLLFKRLDTGELVAKRDIGPGGLYYDPFDGLYYGRDGHEFGPGPDGKYLVATCPNGSGWLVDSRASNCGKPKDNNHKCWVRHGDPKSGKLHVDKNGVTCTAGGGSIVAGDYHGFLHNGRFTDG